MEVPSSHAGWAELQLRKTLRLIALRERDSLGGTGLDDGRAARRPGGQYLVAMDVAGENRVETIRDVTDADSVAAVAEGVIVEPDRGALNSLVHAEER